MSKTYCFDLDNTLCLTDKSEYSHSQPILERIQKVNNLYQEGNKIIVFTSRGMNTFNSDVKKCYDTYYGLTLQQLQEWGVKFDVLILGKPAYDYLIDDKALNDKEFFK